MSSSPVSVFWFRRDLRIDDNHGLFEALSDAGSDLIPIFIFDTNILSELPRDDHRVTLIHKIVSDLNREGSWDFLTEQGFETGERVVLDYVWSAQRFTRAQLCEEIKPKLSASKVVKMKTTSSKFAEAGSF